LLLAYGKEAVNQMDKPTQADQPPAWVELESAKPLAEVEAITSLSRDAIVQHYRHLLVRLTPARWGMKLRHALAIANGTAPRS
jgi:hypothetical protein